MRAAQPFAEKLSKRVAKADSLLCVGLDPDVAKLPAAARGADDAVLAFNRRLIELTAPYACAFKVNSSFYEAQGEEGWRVLKHTVDFVPTGTPVILDGKRADVGPSAEAYARAAFDVLGVDAVTVNPYLGEDALLPFLRRSERGVFVLCHTSNPGAEAVQELSCGGIPLYERVAELALSWNANGNVGLVVGATYPLALRRLRGIAPRMVFLVPGLGPQGADLDAAVSSGLDAAGRGLLLNVSRDIIYDPEPNWAASRWRDDINAACASRVRQPASETLGDEALALALHEAGCVQFGRFTLHSGEVSPIYIDLRLLVSFPTLLQRVARGLGGLLEGLDYDRIAAIPYAALPIATAVAMQLNRPLVYVRREAKTHGLKRAVEGRFQAGERVVVLDDVVTSGDSKLEAITALQAAGLQVEHIVVLVDRQQGGAMRLAQEGYQVHSLWTLSHLLEVLGRHKRITQQQHDEVREWLAR